MAFTPRLTFPPLSLPRSYFLGHHAAGLQKMRALLSTIDLVIECRDYRTPLTSRNPLFEEHLGERPRLVVYTKQDLGSTGTAEDRRREAIIARWDKPHSSIFTSTSARRSIASILSFAQKNVRAASGSLLPSRLLIVGMPNVGKSSLLNALRNVSLKKGKAARIGDQPGITRKIGSSVKIIEANEQHEAVHVLDTPGVFIPYVPDAESMLKLALCGNVKDTIIPPTIIADYLLFHLNLQNSDWYQGFSEPTNDVLQLLEGLARKQGRLKKGGIPDLESAALQFIQRWRAGEMGRFVLDGVMEDAMERRQSELERLGGSYAQARRAEKKARVGKIHTAE